MYASDCGLFASVFAFEWVKGCTTQPIALVVAAMRPHLEQCLSGKQVVLFPKVLLKKRGRKETKMMIKV